MQLVWQRMAVVFACLGLVPGCSQGCELHTTWCEGDSVMICVPDEEPANDPEEAGTDDDSGWLDFIVMLVSASEASDGSGHSEVVETCEGNRLQCVVGDDGFAGGESAFCERNLGPE